ncbi:MAG: hypothetical protein HW410_251 [Nitrosarchaeum sp.]|nr:hypothetical protein [Nitrosarchaeum sp.]
MNIKNNYRAKESLAEHRVNSLLRNITKQLETSADSLI